jgi:hypothetical protein
MNNIGPVGGDVPYTPIQNRLSPLPKETPSVTPDNSVSKPLKADQFIRDTGNLVAHLGLGTSPKKDKNDINNAWDSFAVETDTTDANAVLPLALNTKRGAPIQLRESPEGKESVTAGLMKHITGPNASIVSGIMGGLV